MAKREAYVRGWAEWEGVECHPGVEYRGGDDINDLARRIQSVALTALHKWGGNHLEVCRWVEEWILEQLPGRAFFIETEKEGQGVQIYQPWGMPREDGASGEGGSGAQ